MFISMLALIDVNPFWQGFPYLFHGPTSENNLHPPNLSPEGLSWTLAQRDFNTHTYIYIKPKKQTKCQKLPTRHWGVNHSTCLDPIPCPQLLCFSRPHGLLWPLLARGLKFSWHGSAPFVKRFMPALKNTLSHATPLTTAKTNIWWSDLMIADVKTGH